MCLINSTKIKILNWYRDELVLNKYNNFEDLAL